MKGISPASGRISGYFTEKTSGKLHAELNTKTPFHIPFPGTARGFLALSLDQLFLEVALARHRLLAKCCFALCHYWVTFCMVLLGLIVLIYVSMIKLGCCLASLISIVCHQFFQAAAAVDTYMAVFLHK